MAKVSKILTKKSHPVEKLHFNLIKDKLFALQHLLSTWSGTASWQTVAFFKGTI